MEWILCLCCWRRQKAHTCTPFISIGELWKRLNGKIGNYESSNEVALDNLNTDIAELTNLKDQHPEILAQMKKTIQKFDANVIKNARQVRQVEKLQYLVPLEVLNSNKK